jgi:hypothetical protein
MHKIDDVFFLDSSVASGSSKSHQAALINPINDRGRIDITELADFVSSVVGFNHLETFTRLESEVL